jgi:hypothetical protein
VWIENPWTIKDWNEIFIKLKGGNYPLILYVALHMHIDVSRLVKVVFVFAVLK